MSLYADFSHSAAEDTQLINILEEQFETATALFLLCKTRSHSTVYANLAEFTEGCLGQVLNHFLKLGQSPQCRLEALGLPKNWNQLSYRQELAVFSALCARLETLCRSAEAQAALEGARALAWRLQGQAEGFEGYKLALLEAHAPTQVCPRSPQLAYTC